MENIKIQDNIKENKGLKQKLKFFFSQKFFQNSLNIWMLILNFVFNIANWTLLAVFIRPVDFDIILHYNVFFGVDVVGKWSQVFLMPSTGVFLLFLNLTLAWFFYKREEETAGQLFLLASVIMQLGLLVASAGIILINY